MFHKPEDLLKHTPVDGINRPEFLQLLVQEFRKTNSADSKLQVLANLVNFAYDPVNYPYIRAHKVIDLFIEQLRSDNNKLIAYAAAGLCNLANDPINKDYIIGNGGLENLESSLYLDDDDLIISCITTLMYLYGPEIKTDWLNDFDGSPLVPIQHSYFQFLVIGFPYVFYDLFHKWCSWSVGLFQLFLLCFLLLLSLSIHCFS